MTSRPILLTMGDPVGIGPEIIVRAHAAGELQDAVVVGDPAVLARARLACGLPPVDLPVWQPPTLSDASLASLPWGCVDARAGAAAAACIVAATREVLAGRARAVVTAPIHKEALAAAGVGVPGHTELLQSLASEHVGRPLPVRMMLANDELRVVLVTIHTSLRRAIEALDTPGILETITITHEALQRFGLVAPRIAVAGLNPHAGEGGLFGDEEIRLITPAIEAARSRGIDARGPYAPDTVFMRARDTAARPGEFDAVVAMTHDHGLIPVKYLGVEQGVNLTLGLPLVRTSPDHGTAFDIAGRGLADPASLVAALRMARRLAPG
jgi:4-hydroxythreonine-4-phosphate dehydrogenase